MIVEGNTKDIERPGQFINIKLDGFYLRRPISICNYDDKTISLIYKVVGEGTKYMSQMAVGETFNALCPLGNGYDLKTAPEKPVLIGGGLGIAPLLCLAEKLIKLGKTPQVIGGFNSSDEVVFKDEFKRIGIDLKIATMDGSEGTKGFVTDIMEFGAYVFACGPEPMLQAVYEKAADGQFDFGGRMACGFGACMGCSCKTKYGSKRICKDGPVLMKEEIIW